MIRIGIELNGVIRNLNKQYLKYYLKDVDPTFDDTKLDSNVCDILPSLPFETEHDKYKFVFEDYPYELFGCASPMSSNLHTFINGWIYELSNSLDGEEYEISFFSLGEEELTIQSTYFYLSKSGSRVRNMIFPLNEKDVWKNFDIVISMTDDVIISTPSNKVSVLIEKSDNKQVSTYADLIYKNLEEIIKDKEFFSKAYSKKKISFRRNWLSRKLYKLYRKINGRKKVRV